MKKRLDSLDALRGFDLFCLVALSLLIKDLAHAANNPWMNTIKMFFRHKEWDGFSTWDLVMPLFMFMAGTTIPYSLSKYRDGAEKKALYWRIGRRVLLLWILGMIVQGNLLALDPQRIYLFTNTLQAIAVGWLFSALIFLHTNWRTQIGIAIGLLITFWAAMEFVTIGNYGGGDYTPHGNLAEGIDMLLLGRFRDTATIINGEVVVKASYTYTWILSSLNFVVTVLTGVFAGEILKSQIKQRSKVILLGCVGIAMVVLGWIWNIWHPVIKHIWTSSMVLVSSGYCFLLMALFYYWIDCRGHNRHLTFLKVYGMNSITAYVVSHIISFSSISKSLFFGLEQYAGNYYDLIICLSNVSILFILLYILYRNKIFLRV